mgnify:FL=1
MKIRVLLVDDHNIVRHGMRRMLKRSDTIVVVAEAADGLEAVRLAVEKKPDVVLMDIKMPGMNGIEATRRIVGQVPSACVICASAYEDGDLLREMAKAGAVGFLSKDCNVEDLIRAITEVAAGNGYIEPRISRILLEGLGDEAGGSVLGSLTEREREVLRLISQGRCAKEIAQTLGLSVRTVDAHCRNLMAKCGVHSAVALARRAAELGLPRDSASPEPS